MAETLPKSWVRFFFIFFPFFPCFFPVFFFLSFFLPLSARGGVRCVYTCLLCRHLHVPYAFPMPFRCGAFLTGSISPSSIFSLSLSLSSKAYIEELINEHMECTKKGHGHKSRLKQLVPTIGTFHTPLMLQAAFEE